MRDRTGRIFATVVVGGAFVAVGWGWSEADLARNERAAGAALKALASAEADFRGNDRDGNRIQDFWTGDVAGLHDLPDPSTGKPMALIAAGLAAADGAPLSRHRRPRTPFAGYFFVVMQADDSVPGSELYAQDTKGQPNHGPYYNPSKFGFCAYPADHGRTGRMTFIINEGNSIFKIDNQGRPLLRWPDDDLCPRCLAGRKGHPCRGSCLQ